MLEEGFLDSRLGVIHNGIDIGPVPDLALARRPVVSSASLTMRSSSAPWRGWIR